MLPETSGWITTAPGWYSLDVYFFRGEFETYKSPIIAWNIPQRDYAISFAGEIRTYTDLCEDPNHLLGQTFAGEPTDPDREALLEAARKRVRRKTGPPPTLNDLAPARSWEEQQLRALKVWNIVEPRGESD